MTPSWAESTRSGSSLSRGLNAIMDDGTPAVPDACQVPGADGGWVLVPPGYPRPTIRTGMRTTASSASWMRPTSANSSKLLLPQVPYTIEAEAPWQGPPHLYIRLRRDVIMLQEVISQVNAMVDTARNKHVQILKQASILRSKIHVRYAENDHHVSYPGALFSIPARRG